MTHMGAAFVAAQKGVIYIFSEIYVIFRFLTSSTMHILDSLLPHPNTPISHRSPKIVGDER